MRLVQDRQTPRLNVRLPNQLSSRNALEQVAMQHPQIRTDALRAQIEPIRTQHFNQATLEKITVQEGDREGVGFKLGIKASELTPAQRAIINNNSETDAEHNFQSVQEKFSFFSAKKAESLPELSDEELLKKYDNLLSKK